MASQHQHIRLYRGSTCADVFIFEQRLCIVIKYAGCSKYLGNVT